MNPNKLTIDIAIAQMRELQEKGEAKLVPFGYENDAIAVVEGKHFYVKHINHYRYLGTPQVKEDTQHQKGSYHLWSGRHD
jgi:hypothetical protein